MDKRVNSDAEAWDFLINVVRKSGEFRIHTNRQGLRVFLHMKKREYCGYDIHYVRRITVPLSKKDNDIPMYVHREDKFESPDYYEGTIVRESLMDCVNYHLEQMPGNILRFEEPFDSDLIIDEPGWCDYTLEWKGDLKSFRELKIY